MKTIVPDASVVVKWYLPERNHEPARRLRDTYVNGTVRLTSPDLMPYEAINALRYSGQLNGSSLQKATESLTKFGINLVPFSELGPVPEISELLEVSIYDAAYVSLAESTESTVYTSDEELIDAIQEKEGELSASIKHIREFENEPRGNL